MIFQELGVRCGNKLLVFVPMCFVCEFCVGESVSTSSDLLVV